MNNTSTYICSHCGKEHTSMPAWGYGAPQAYSDLSDEEQEHLAELSDDFCVIRHPEQTDYFIRCTLTQKVNDHCEDLEYGLWVSLSETSFHDYQNNFDNTDHEASYFGWLCNHIAGYEGMRDIPTSVHTRTGGYRPEIIPHDDYEHPFVKDYYDGISKKEAERRIHDMLNSKQ